MQNILVTGSNKGIGLAIIEALLAKGDVQAIMCCRDLSRGEEARRELLEKNPDYNSRLQLVMLNVCDDESVRNAAQSIGTIDCLVNNAGVLVASIDDLVNTNIWGPKRVTEAFLPFLKPNGRIVHMSSGSAPNFISKCSETKSKVFLDSNIELSAIEGIVKEYIDIFKSGGLKACEESGFGQADQGEFNPYGMSKAALNAYTLYSAKNYPNLKINSCSPGLIKTDLLRPVAESSGKDFDRFAAEWDALPTSESTVSTMHLLFDPLVQSGHYYGSDGKRSPMGKYRKPGTAEYNGENGN